MLRFAALFLLTFFSPAYAQLTDDARPSLLFSREDIPTLRERIQRPPYDAWWSTVLTRAQNGLPDSAPERTKARLAKTLAFAYLMTDEKEWAQQALAIMRNTRFPPRGGDMGQPHNEGELVAHYALAYDMLHSYAEANDPSSLQEIRSILAEEAQRIEAGIVVAEIDLGLRKLRIRLDETPHLDNWHIRAYGGLGIAALAMRDHPEAATWSARALELVVRSLALQIEPQSGAYAEGPFYSRYSADVYLPYFIALKRIEGRDLFEETSVHAMHQWSLNLRMPNGRRPNIDDGHLDDFYGHYLSSIADNGGEFRWDWENNHSGLYVRQFSEPDAIALYDDKTEPTRPVRQPTVFMPSGGDAVFRSDWTEDATYLLLRGENGHPRKSGLAHEHPDETSFVLYAAGEMLALDAGYINFENHGKVNRGANHNLVLVNGQGPPLFMAQGEAIGGGNDAFIRDVFISDNGDYAEVHAAYGGVDFIRRMLFVDKQYFILADALRSDAEHAYEWRLHGNGGGTSGGLYAREENLARWARDRGELLAFLPTRPGRSFGEVDTLHSFDAGQELTHTALRVQQRGADDHYLAVLYPRAQQDSTPIMTTLRVSGGEGVLLATDGRRDIAWTKDPSATVATAASYSSDGAFCWIGHFAADGRSLGAGERRFVAHDATRLTHADTVLFEASSAVDISLHTSSERIAGYVQGPDTGYTVLFPVGADRIPSNIDFTGELLDAYRDSSAFRLELSGQGTLSVDLAQRETVAYAPLVLRNKDLIGDFGPFLAQNGRERLFITYQNGISAHIPERAARERARNICRLYGRTEAVEWLAMPSLTFSEPTLTQVTDTGLQIRNDRGLLEINSRGRILGPNKYFSITCGTAPYGASKRVARRTSAHFELEAAYPNPFNSEVAIRFTLDGSQPIEIAIYNVAGQKVRTVASGALSVGTHRLIWDGRDDLGREVATGLYLVQLSDRQRSVVRKITLLH